MHRSPYSRKREELISKQSDRLNSQIDKSQNRFYKILLSSFIDSLPVDEDGVLTPNINSHFLPQKLDNLYDQFIEDDIAPIIGSFSLGVKKLLDANEDYFDSIKPSNNHEEKKNSILRALGIGLGVTLGGSLIQSFFTDRALIGTVKALTMTAMSTGLTITAFKIAAKEVVLRQGGGLLKKLFEEKLPDPYVKIDRVIGNNYAVELKLNYAVYRGGTIGTSRDFCIERNNKVFSRNEIMKFGTPQDEWGGYDDKGTGEFQGKTDPYNPLIDLGGYNCRHSFNWISDELAFHLRSELKPTSQNPQLN